SVTRRLFVPLLRQCGRPRQLWVQLHRAAPERRQIRGPHSEGRETGRPASPGSDEIRTRHQSSNCKRARPHRAREVARACRRGHRMSNRRDLLTFLGSAAVAWPVAARAQPTGDVRRIAVLMGTATNELRRSYLATFMQRLEQLGWANGRNVHVETRWWAGTLEQMRLVVAELLALSPEVIMAFSNPAVALLKATTDTVPIVFVGVGDPIGDGFVASLAHPGRNITGFAGTDGPIGGKWLEVLKETAPQVNRVMMIMHPETPIHQAFWRSFEAAAPRFSLRLRA